MNCAILQWVADQDDLSLHLQGVLLRLSKLADEEGRIALGQAAIAPLIRLGERQTRAAIKELVSVKAVLRVRRGAVGRGRAPDMLTLNFERQRDIGGASPVERDNVDVGEHSPVSPPPAKIPDNADIGGPSPVPMKNGDMGDNAAALPVSGIEDAEFVDNGVPHIEHAPARAEDNLLEDTLEAKPQTLSQSSTIARPRGWVLADAIAARVNSPYLDPAKSGGGLYRTSGRIVSWMDTAQLGADLDVDVVPAVRDVCERYAEYGGDPITSWKYFDKAIRKAVTERLASELPLDLITHEEVQNVQRSRRSTYNTAGRRGTRCIETDILMRDIAEGASDPVR